MNNTTQTIIIRTDSVSVMALRRKLTLKNNILNLILENDVPKIDVEGGGGEADSLL